MDQDAVVIGKEFTSSVSHILLQPCVGAVIVEEQPLPSTAVTARPSPQPRSAAATASDPSSWHLPARAR